MEARSWGKPGEGGHQGLEEMEVGQGPRESCLLSGQDGGRYILGEDEVVGVVCCRQVPEQEERWEWE